MNTLYYGDNLIEKMEKNEYEIIIKIVEKKIQKIKADKEYAKREYEGKIDRIEQHIRYLAQQQNKWEKGSNQDDFFRLAILLVLASIPTLLILAGIVFLGVGSPFFEGEYSPLLGGILIIIMLTFFFYGWGRVIVGWYEKKIEKLQAKESDTQREMVRALHFFDQQIELEKKKLTAKGLIEYNGKWLTLAQIDEFEKKQKAKGLVYYMGKWIPRERANKLKGLVKYKNRWVRPETAKKMFEAEQKAKGLVKYKNKWGTPEEVRKWQEIDVGLDNNFAGLSPYEFEEFIAELFQKMGYETYTTPKSGDYGIDVVAKKGKNVVAIQVKRFAEGNNVGNRDVQRALGSMHHFKANKCIIITTSDFTVQAEEQAKEAPIELWNKDILHRFVRKYFVGEDSDK